MFYNEEIRFGRFISVYAIQRKSSLIIDEIFATINFSFWAFSSKIMKDFICFYGNYYVKIHWFENTSMLHLYRINQKKNQQTSVVSQYVS